MRGALGFLILCVSVVAQVAPESSVCPGPLNDTEVRLRQLSGMFARQAAQFAKLTLTLGDQAAQSSAWDEMQTAQSGVVNGIREFTAQARISVGLDQNYLKGTLNLADYQAASQQLARTTVQTISTLIRVMEQQATAATALPQPDRALRLAFIGWSIAFHQWERALDLTVHALEDAGRAWRNRVDAWCL